MGIQPRVERPASQVGLNGGEQRLLAMQIIQHPRSKDPLGFRGLGFKGLTHAYCVLSTVPVRFPPACLGSPSKKPFLNGLKGQGLLANGICFFHILVDPVQNSHNNRKFITTWTIKISVMRGQNHY